MRNKIFLARFAAFALMIPVVAQAAFLPSLSVQAEAAEGSYEEYRKGTKLEEALPIGDFTLIEISTEEELHALAENCRIDTWSKDKRVLLKEDISLNQYPDLQIPIFSGFFDGDGHTISGLSITGEGSAAGLFRYLQAGGRIQNLKVRGTVAPDGSQSQVGGIVGVNYGEILSCSFSGRVIGDNEVGGIAGVNGDSGENRLCNSDATITGNHSTGGIVGNNHGVINNCKNTGSVNTYSTEVSYEISDFTMENLEDINSTSNVAAHTDTGGIAGLSDGKIYYCSNAGKIGYEHVGYNVGGIVGRLHEGYLQSCTNTGHIYGRKDVGGIAGQMEPFLEVLYLSGKLNELDTEMDHFLDLLDIAFDDISDYSNQASALSDQITANLKNINSAGSNLSSTAIELWYIYNQELTGINQNLKVLNSELSDAYEENGGGNGGNSGGDVSGGDVSGGNASGSNVSGGDVSGGDWSGGGILNDIVNNGGGSGSSGHIQYPEDTESYEAALRKFEENASGHIDTMTSATNDRSGGIKDNLSTLNDNMEAAGKNLEQLANVLEAGSDQMDSNVDALMDQARVLRNLLSEIRDDLFRYEGMTIEDTSDEETSGEPLGQGAAPGDEEADEAEDHDSESTFTEESYYDTTSFQQGKITLSVNKGIVEADTNVGGIVGQIATEYDMDPEDDISYTGSESFDIEQTIKAVVRDSSNLGEVISKKDYAGGIVGKADFGAIISCESYGDVTSTDGNYVGGIAGFSSYAIRSCYAMGNLSGKSRVGGIAGEGCDIFYSYGYNTIDYTGEAVGAIAGKLKDDGTLFGNYYVEDSLGAVDGISYEGGAAPISYEELCSLEDIPKEFSGFTITFMADGKELASYKCSYGDSISEQQIPEIPVKEGCYGRWPEFDFDCITRSHVLEAEYEKWVSALASNDTDESNKSLLLVEGNFLPEMELEYVKEDDSYSFRIADYADPVQVRVLCEDPKRAVIEVKEEDEYREVTSKEMGSYLVFNMDAPGEFRVLYPKSKKPLIIGLITGGIAIVGVLILLICRLAGKRRKKGKKMP